MVRQARARAAREAEGVQVIIIYRGGKETARADQVEILPDGILALRRNDEKTASVWMNSHTWDKIVKVKNDAS